MAFDAISVNAVESSLHVSFTNSIGHRSTGASTFSGRERETGESEMNNEYLKCQ